VFLNKYILVIFIAEVISLGKPRQQAKANQDSKPRQQAKAASQSVKPLLCWCNLMIVQWKFP